MPVPLSDEEWEEINDSLPDVIEITDRIRGLPGHNKISLDTGLRTDEGRILLRSAEETSKLLYSNPALRDAGEFLYNARYALGQAIGVRQYFLSKSEIDKDNDHIMADLRSRFYAEYIPILLVGSRQHAATAIRYLYFDGIEHKANAEQKFNGAFLDKLQKIKVSTSENVYITARKLYCSNFKKIVKLRNSWTHNQPPRIESFLYRPKRHDFRFKMGEIDAFGIGGYSEPEWASLDEDWTKKDYIALRWDDYIKLLKEGLEVLIPFLAACVDAWEAVYYLSSQSPK